MATLAVYAHRGDDRYGIALRVMPSQCAAALQLHKALDGCVQCIAAIPMKVRDGIAFRYLISFTAELHQREDYRRNEDAGHEML